MAPARLATVLAATLAGWSAVAQNPVPPPAVLPDAGPPAAVSPAFPPPVITEASHGVMDLTPPGLFPSHGPVATLPGGEGCKLAEDAPGGWFATADLLIWRARMDGTSYALVDPTRDLSPQGKVENLPLGSQAGFRFGVGYRLPGQGWDVGFGYTHFRSTASASVAAPPGGVVYPTLTRPGGVDAALAANAAGSLNYNLFDADFGRTWQVDPHLALRAFGGVRFASIDTETRAGYDGLQARGANVLATSGFDGAGPTIGTEARWLTGGGLSFFGSARGGLLYGDFRGSVRETNANGAVLNADVSDTFTGVAPFTTLALGGTYRWRNVNLTAGYEITHWFNVVTRPDTPDDFAFGRVVRRRGDLNLDGVFFRLAVNY